MDLITDRTEADVLLGNEKGRYGYADLNRVEAAVAELCALAKKLDIHQNLTVKTDWAAPDLFSVRDWPTESQMHRYLENIRSVCAALGTVPVLPQTMEKLDWQGANQIEQALQTAHLRLQSVLQTYHYSGECYAGEENIL